MVIDCGTQIESTCTCDDILNDVCVFSLNSEVKCEYNTNITMKYVLFNTINSFKHDVWYVGRMPVFRMYIVGRTFRYNYNYKEFGYLWVEYFLFSYF